MSPAGAITLGGPDSPVISIKSDRKVSSTPGTAIRLSTKEYATGVIIQALHTNTALIAIGGAAVKAAAGSEKGTLLGAGQELTIYAKDLADVYMDVRINGHGVTLNAFK